MVWLATKPADWGLLAMVNTARLLVMLAAVVASPGFWHIAIEAPPIGRPEAENTWSESGTTWARSDTGAKELRRAGFFSWVFYRLLSLNVSDRF
jgi:hypothetical protein